MGPRTAAERYFEEQLRNPGYRRAYEAARARIEKIDELVRSLDARRAALGMSKADLARAAGIQPEAVRRLFSMNAPNPTAATLFALADALGLDVVARPRPRSSRKLVASRQA